MLYSNIEAAMLVVAWEFAVSVFLIYLRIARRVSGAVSNTV